MNINPNKYQIKFFRCGDGSKGGDGIVIRLFDIDDKQHLYVIDGGYQATGEQIVKFIKEVCKSKSVDLIINTHPDRDHISGIIKIIESDLIVGGIVINRPWKDSGFTTDYFKDKRITENSLISRIKEEFDYANTVEELAKSKKITIYKCFEGYSCDSILEFIGPSQKLYRSKLLSSDKTPESVFEEWNKPLIKKTFEEEDYDSKSPIKWFYDENTSDINETSIVTVLNIGNLHFLFTGDTGKDGLSSALDFYDTQHVKGTSRFTYVQLPHHGSRKNITPELINRFATPSFIISCPPEGEHEGHPSRRLINKILELKPNAEIYRTGTSSFNIHKGLGLKFNHQNPAKANKKMDGNTK